jgi:Trk-type K+ transport system membrane component
MKTEFTTSMNRKVCYEAGYNKAKEDILKLIDEETEDEKRFDLLIRIVLYFIVCICSFTLIVVVYQFLQLLEVIK